MRVAVVYNVPTPSRYHSIGEGVAVDSVMEAVEAVVTALEGLGHETRELGLRPPLSEAVARLRVLDDALVFNLFEGFAGRPDTEWLVAQKLERLRLAFTGASSECLALCLDKALTKERLAASGVSTPAYQLLRPEDARSLSLGFPVIVKPHKEDASHGCTSESVVHDFEGLERQVSAVARGYGGCALAEAFLDGREFNASVLGGRHPMVLPPSEVVYAEDFPGPRLLTYAAKWLPQDPAYVGSRVVCPAPVSDVMRLEIEGVALAAWRAVGSPPYARVDLRCDQKGSPHVLEVNPNPDLSPQTGMANQARAAGMEYGSLIQAIVAMAIEEGKFVESHAAALAG